MQNSFVIHNIISVFFFGGGGKGEKFLQLFGGKKKKEGGKGTKRFFFPGKMGPSHNIMRRKKSKALFCLTLHFHP